MDMNTALKNGDLKNKFRAEAQRRRDKDFKPRITQITRMNRFLPKD
jgi:hypothetical protein